MHVNKIILMPWALSANAIGVSPRKVRCPKEKLLLVLKRPDIVLHRNGREGEIRDYVKCLTISGGTLRDLGKHGRDGFARLKRTCRKLGVSSWDYLGDRTR